MQSVHVLTYHSGNIDGNDYTNNNLVALQHDLAMLAQLRRPIVPLRNVAEAVIAGDFSQLPERAVALSFDDGLDFDFMLLTHPLHGPQTSVQQVLRDFAQRTQLPVHATAFVIASPAARRQIADAEMLGHPWISDTWWQAAVDSGLFHIGNHSWDHVSASVTHAPTEAERRGASRFIDNPAAAQLQVRHAREYIDQVAPNPGSALLAYPYGDYSAYLADEYLPSALNADGAIAAFTAEPAPVTAQTHRWKLPRYTCGTHWKSPEALALLLDD